MIRSILLIVVGVSISAAPVLGQPAANGAKTELAEQLLQAAESGASNLQGVDRAYAYWIISRGFSKINLREEQQSLKKSCDTALALGRDDRDNVLREKIQLDCIRRMMVIQPALGAELLDKAAPDVRQQIFASEAAKFATKGDIDTALTMLASEVSQGARYPYGRAFEVIRAIPPAERGDKDRIFFQALACYRQKHSRFDVGAEDLGTLLIRVWRDLSPGLVLATVDELLNVAQEEVTTDSHLELSLRSGSGEAAFGSLYQYRLFQLLPVLRELDPSRADALLKENLQVKTSLQKYTNGLQSFSDTYSEAPKDDSSFSLTLRVNQGPASGVFNASIQTLQIQSEASEILAAVPIDAANALKNALLLQDAPDAFGSPKGDLLLAIAQRSVKQHSDVTERALLELSKSLDHYPILTQCHYLLATAGLYARIGDSDRAQAALKETMKRVKKLYDSDTNSDDPNQSLKSAWPSTVVSRACVAVAGRISSRLANDLVMQLPDPDLRIFARIERASSMLGIPSYPALIQERHKQEKGYRVLAFPIPSGNDGLLAD
ncbi:MAG TPA: hypothetical protein VG759_26265 [Candidatus Angelobacter sp.]|nr:hypothetical protein [Candidatus Angelobacter sp.]